MRSSSTTAQGTEFENKVVQVFDWANAWRSRSSGASAAHPVDVTTDVSVIECESTESQSYSLKLKFWREVFQKQRADKIPMLAVRFRDTGTERHTDLVIMSLKDASAILEELEAHREASVKHY